MSSDPIIGGNWATTEPRHRKPDYRPRDGKLHTLTMIELDVLDALLISGRASSILAVSTLLDLDTSTVLKVMNQFEKFGLVSCYEEQVQRGAATRFFTVTDKGKEAFDQCLNALIERMEKRGDGGIRNTRSCS